MKKPEHKSPLIPLEPEEKEKIKPRKPARYEDDAEAQDRTAKYRQQLQHLQWERDPTLLVLRGHLYVEHELDYVLTYRITGDVLDALKLGFMRKLNLAKDLGLLSAETYAATKMLNDYRTRLSHDLEASIGEAEVDAVYTLLERGGAFEGSGMSKADDPMRTLSRCIRAIYTLYTGERWSIEAGKRVRVRLGPWVTHEIDKETFEEKRREQYEEARRLERLLDESPEARAEMKAMVEEADRKFREKYARQRSAKNDRA